MAHVPNVSIDFQKATRKAVAQVCFSRISMAFPGMSMCTGYLGLFLNALI